jgi:predicted small lipoprotein YifL
MLKQFAGSATRTVLLFVMACALSLVMTACGVKGPLVHAPKGDANAESAPATPPTPPPLIKDPAQPERRP